MANESEPRIAREGILDTIESIDRGELDATPAQRAYLVGAADAIRFSSKIELPIFEIR